MFFSDLITTKEIVYRLSSYLYEAFDQVKIWSVINYCFDLQSLKKLGFIKRDHCQGRNNENC